MTQRPSDTQPQGEGNGSKVNRRGFLKTVAATAGVSCLPILQTDANAFSLDAFLQKHFYEMSKEELERVIERLENEYKKTYNKKEFRVGVDPPLAGVRFAYALNLAKCIGCRRCAKACVKENNQHRGSEERGDQIEYIRVLEMKKGSLDLEKSNHYYDHPVPDKDSYYMPVQCHHCNAAPCTKVCPVEATWQEADGIVVVDYNWCIGCRYCEAACPYWARRFNFSKPRIPDEEVNTNTHYLGNRPREKGVMEKCTFCIQRTRKGLNPACLEICPTGSRKFGNILDPQSEIRYIIENKRVFILKEELGTDPSFYYFFD